VIFPLDQDPFDPRHRITNGKLIPLKPTLQINERKRREEGDRRPTSIMVVLVASAFVLDSQAPNDEEALQELQQQPSSFCKDLLNKACLSILNHAI
jgi:hypothetical protein